MGPQFRNPKKEIHYGAANIEKYRPVHKAIRHMMYATTHGLGVADFQDETDADEALSALEITMSLLVIHAGQRRNTYFLP